MSRTPEQNARAAARKRRQRAEDPEKFRQRDRDRYGEKRREQRRNSRASDPLVVRERNQAAYAARAKEIRASTAAYKRANAERAAAHHAVAYAIKTGALVRPDHCSRCGCECKPDAAHHDYSKPLDVTWLCRRCHMRMDKAVSDGQAAVAS